MRDGPASGRAGLRSETLRAWRRQISRRLRCHTPQRRSLELDQAIRENPSQFRVLTGDRPTGPLHVGHLFGTLLNRVRLQDLGVEVMVLIADYQVLTDRDAPQTLPAGVLGQVADYLAVGIDPRRSAIFAHSQVEPLNQLLI